MSDEGKPLTRKQQVFVDEYLKTWNASESARRAGYSEKTAYAIGSRLLRNVEISEAIQTKLAEMHMSADEALTLLADMARADIGEMMDISSVGYNMDIKKAYDAGLTKLIKKIKQKTVTIIGKGEEADDTEIHTLEVELYDAQAAIEKILRVHGKFTDHVDVTSGGEPLKPPQIIEIIRTVEKEKEDE